MSSRICIWRHLIPWFVVFSSFAHQLNLFACYRSVQILCFFVIHGRLYISKNISISSRLPNVHCSISSSFFILKKNTLIYLLSLDYTTWIYNSTVNKTMGYNFPTYFFYSLYFCGSNLNVSSFNSALIYLNLYFP